MKGFKHKLMRDLIKCNDKRAHLKRVLQCCNFNERMALSEMHFAVMVHVPLSIGAYGFFGTGFIFWGVQLTCLPLYYEAGEKMLNCYKKTEYTKMLIKGLQ